MIITILPLRRCDQLGHYDITTMTVMTMTAMTTANSGNEQADKQGVSSCFVNSNAQTQARQRLCFQLQR